MLDLSIVILSWNTRQLLHDCLSSVFAQANGLDLQVLVVDNNSTDDSREMVEKSFPQVDLIRNRENVGFAAANNQAFPFCQAEYVLLLNSDTVILGDALAVMLDFLKRHPAVGAVGPKVIHPELNLRVLSCGHQPTLRTVFNQYTGLASLIPNPALFPGINLIMGVHDDRERPVEWISGACLMVRKSVIEQVGGLDESWFMYAEDFEWCDRIRSAGWLLYSLPSAEIEHLLGASSKQNKDVSTMWITSLRSYYRARNRASWLEMIAFDLVMAAGLGARSALYYLRGLADSKNREHWWDQGRTFFLYAAALLPRRQSAARPQPGS